MSLPRIEDWRICYREDGSYYLTGRIFNDCRAADGSLIRTSNIVILDLDLMEAQTKNTLYQLGNHL